MGTLTHRTKKRIRVAFFTLIGGCLSLQLISCAGSSGVKAKSEAEQMWGSERVCLPCHVYQKPIARNHNYRCDTCHLGNPWAENKEDGHFELVVSPQLPADIGRTCDKCHRRILGRDVPYNAEFIRDVIVSHKQAPEEQLEWQE